MQFKQKVVVSGMKRSKGDFEGQAFDSTKFYIETDLDDRSGNALGKATSEYAFGKSDEFEKYKHLQFPFEAEATLELMTTGKVTKVALLDLAPVAVKKAA